jgi:hypothetical protein
VHFHGALIYIKGKICDNMVGREWQDESDVFVPSFVLICILNLIVAVAGIFVIGRLFEQEKIINQ